MLCSSLLLSCFLSVWDILKSWGRWIRKLVGDENIYQIIYVNLSAVITFSFRHTFQSTDRGWLVGTLKPPACKTSRMTSSRRRNRRWFWITQIDSHNFGGQGNFLGERTNLGAAAYSGVKWWLLKVVCLLRILISLSLARGWLNFPSGMGRLKMVGHLPHHSITVVSFQPFVVAFQSIS